MTSAFRARVLSLLAASSLAALSACGSDSTPITEPPGTRPDTTVTQPPTTPTTPGSGTTSTLLASLGIGAVNERFTAEVWVRGTTAYTTTWGSRGANRGNAVKIWNVAGNTPVLVDSVIVSNATTLGDVQVSDDGKLLVVAIESNPNGGLAIYDVSADPRKPVLLVRTTIPELRNGVHTAEVARVNGKLYAFCAVDPTNNDAAKLVIVDLSNPAVPVPVKTMVIGAPFVHDVFVRDGVLFTGEWADGVGIYDIGAQGGTAENPRMLWRIRTVGGSVHNMWWFHDPSTGSRKYLFVGQEGPGSIGSSSSGDVHVVDINDLTKQPVEVAAYNLPGAGTHNFSLDEPNGFLYAAYYNGGVRVLDVRGDLGTCTAEQKFADGRCNLGLMGREKARFTGNGTNPVYIWGVHLANGALYSSDMLNGLWKSQSAVR